MSNRSTMRLKKTALVILTLVLIAVISFLAYLHNPLTYQIQPGSEKDVVAANATPGETGQEVRGTEPATPGTKVQPSEPAQPTFGFDPTRAAQRLQLDEITIVKLSGTSYQMGYQHGQLLAPEIHQMVKLFYTITGLKKRPVGWIKGIPIFYWAHALYQSIPVKYREEMQGIADGAKVSIVDIALLNVYDELFNFSQCTNLAVWGAYTRDGELVHGRNLDYPIANYLWNRQVVFLYQPVGAQRFLSISWPGQVGVLTGMNESGLTLGSMTSRAYQHSIHGVPTGILYREVMETSWTIDAVEKILKAAPRTIGNNLMVTSKVDGQAAVFELTVNSVAKRLGDGVLGAANHFTQLADEGTTYTESVYRQNRAEFLASSYHSQDAPIGSEEMADILDDRQTEGAFSNPIGNATNVQSVVFLPRRGELWIAINDVVPAASGPFWGFKYAPTTDQPLQYLGRTTVHDTYLRSQINFHRKDLAFWTDEKIGEVLYRYRERNTEDVHFLHQKAEFYLGTGRYSTAAKLYQQLLERLEKDPSPIRDNWTISYRCQLEFDLARAYYFADDAVAAGEILERLSKQSNLPDYLLDQIKEYLRKVRKLRAFDGKIYG